MPSLLITTSRNTSNRVRSFARDLHTIFPDSERFNRGGMSLNELVARIGQSRAKAALVITMSKGNPRKIQFLLSTGDTAATIFLESTLLRREVVPSKIPRVNEAIAVCVEKTASQHTLAIANFLAELLDLPITDSSAPMNIGEKGLGQIELRFSSLSNGKILWTQYHAFDGREIGPRMRITKYEVL